VVDLELDFDEFAAKTAKVPVFTGPCILALL
jgi:hypothetical protein